MDRLHVLRIARVGADGGVHDLRVLLHLCLEESIRTIAVKQWQERCDQGFDVTVNGKRNIGTTAQLFGAVLNLNGERIGQELIVGEVGTQHDQNIGIVHAFSSGTITQQAGHTDIKGVVVLDKILTAQSMADWGLQNISEFDDLIVCALNTGTGKDGNLLCTVEDVCELADILLIRGEHGTAGGNVLW